MLVHSASCFGRIGNPVCVEKNFKNTQTVVAHKNINTENAVLDFQEVALLQPLTEEFGDHLLWVTGKVLVTLDKSCR